MYLHDVGETDDSFTKEEMLLAGRQAFHNLTHPLSEPAVPSDTPPVPPAASTAKSRSSSLNDTEAESVVNQVWVYGCRCTVVERGGWS